ncbi:MAG: hypothetical protein WAW20_20250, partial [Anaerolineae bacterium]
ELMAGLVRNFFRVHGEKDVRAWLAAMGVTQAIVTHEVTLLAAPVVETALRSGYAEKRIRRRLDAFYSAYVAACSRRAGLGKATSNSWPCSLMSDSRPVAARTS